MFVSSVRVKPLLIALAALCQLSPTAVLLAVPPFVGRAPQFHSDGLDWVKKMTQTTTNMRWRPSSKHFPRPANSKLPAVLLYAVYLYKQTCIYTTSSHPKAHQRARQALRNSLRLLPRHLNNTKQALNTDTQPPIVRSQTSLAEHVNGAGAIARAAE